MTNSLSSFIGSSLLGIGMTFSIASAPAEAVSFGFDNIPTSNTNGDGIVSQFTLDVTDDSGGQVLFKLSNVGPIASFVGDFYIDDANRLLSNPDLNGGDGFSSSGNVKFAVPRGNLNFPQGNNINFDEDFGYRADRPGSNNQGIDVGEMFGLKFNADYNSVLDGLESGNLRFGIHVQGISPSGQSDSFVNDTTPVPEPLTIIGSVAALGVGAHLKRKFTAKTDFPKA